MHFYTDSASALSWPAGDKGYGYESASRDKYGYIYTIARLGDSHPYARIFFEISGDEQRGNDLTEWGGVCITYTANESFFINIRFPDDNKATEYDVLPRLVKSPYKIINMILTQGSYGTEKIKNHLAVNAK